MNGIQKEKRGKKVESTKTEDEVKDGKTQMASISNWNQ